MRYIKEIAIGVLLASAFTGTLRADSTPTPTPTPCPREREGHRSRGLELCLDLTGGAPEATLFPGRRKTLRPNELLTVYVHHEAGVQVSARAAGRAGLSAGAILGGDEGAPGQTGSRELQDVPIAGWSTFTFSPFTPGQVVLEIVATPEGGIKISSEDRTTLRALTDRLSDACLEEEKGGACALRDALGALELQETGASDAEFRSLLVHLSPLKEPGAKTTPGAYGAATSEVGRLGQAPSPEVRTLTLFVEQSYVGALRLGVSGIRGATQPRYEAVDLGGLSEGGEALGPEIVQTAGGTWDSELVLTYTHYLWQRRETDTYLRVGAFFGMGVVDLEALKVGLSSFYLGADFGWHNLSVGPAVVLRRVDSLADGLEIGTPVADNAGIVTTAAWQPGFAIVVNAPLELMRTKAP